jgi:hypothetical protein
MGALAHSMSGYCYTKRREHDHIVNKANVFAIGLSLAVYEGVEAREELTRSPFSRFASDK